MRRAQANNAVGGPLACRKDRCRPECNTVYVYGIEMECRITVHPLSFINKAGAALLLHHRQQGVEHCVACKR